MTTRFALRRLPARKMPNHPEMRSLCAAQMSTSLPRTHCSLRATTEPPVVLSNTTTAPACSRSRLGECDPPAHHRQKRSSLNSTNRPPRELYMNPPKGVADPVGSFAVERSRIPNSPPRLARIDAAVLLKLYPAKRDLMCASLSHWLIPHPAFTQSLTCWALVATDASKPQTGQLTSSMSSLT